MMELRLPNSVSSSQDVSALIRDIRLFAQWFSHNMVKQKVGSKKITSQPELSAVAVEMLRDWGAKEQLSQKRLDDLLEQLEKFKKTAPTLTITLAAPASGDLKQTLVGWCRKNIAANVLVDFRFNSTLLGGMVVRQGSRVFDWSFRRQILASKSKFAKALRDV
jgi:F0F1-type ATP synthase delta subunit